MKHLLVAADTQVLVLLDLSTEFDSIDRCILFTHLKHLVGVFRTKLVLFLLRVGLLLLMLECHIHLL